jgi:hypothetical protein
MADSFPGVQAEHSDWAVAFWYLPAGQASHAALMPEANWYLAAGQCSQLVLPVPAWNCPVAQSWQVPPPDGWYWPAAQSEQASAPSTAYVPLAQAAQEGAL